LDPLIAFYQLFYVHLMTIVGCCNFYFLCCNSRLPSTNFGATNTNMMTPIEFDFSGFSSDQLKHFYKEITLPRMIEEKMLIALRQGRISKWFSGFGQEAISVGCALGLDAADTICTMHRNLGVFTARNIPINQLFAQFQGKPNGFTKGRDRSFHFGSNAHHIVGMISHLGPQLGVANGLALGGKISGYQEIALAFTGDGGASEGDFHESLNVAAVWDLPVIFVVENNQWGLSTPSREQFRCKQFIDKGIGYGMEAVQVDGNNLLEVYQTIQNIAADIRKNPRPVLVEAITFRMRGHEEASGTKYYPEGLAESWQIKDPVENFEKALLDSGILSKEEVDQIKATHKKNIQEALDEALAAPEVVFDEAQELKDVYAPFIFEEVKPLGALRDIRLIDAVTEALDESMKKFPNLVLMGQDIAEYGGVFKVTQDFVERYGKERVRNTPLCESAIIGTGLGLSIKGFKAMVEMQFADFVSEGFTQIVNNLAKIHYRWGQNADVVIRMPTGAGVAAGPFHSQSNEAWFTHVPGLKVFYPAFPYDAKGLLIAAFEDPNPVLFFEHKALYRSVSGPVPEGYYNVAPGKAAVVAAGSTATIISYGMGVHKALELQRQHPEWQLEVIDLRTLAPLDWETIYASVQKTGRALVLTEDTLFGSIASDIAANIQETQFRFLDAPVKRLGAMETPVPFASILEAGFLPFGKLEAAVTDLLAF
jgi:2-oxoisovalerate dehydrogenase E1 component